jgi:rubrerythrin
MALLSLYPSIHVTRLLLRRRRARMDPGKQPCPTCGFDLRAHSPGDKCPECGTPKSDAFPNK